MFKTLYLGPLILILLMTAPPVRAEPGPAVQWLMNEPASLFDIGMIRLEKKIKEYNQWVSEKAGGRVAIIPWYLWEKNRLDIRIVYTDFKNPLFDRKKCSNSVRLLRNLMKNTSQIHQLFSHMDYTSTKRPANMKEKIEQIVEISFSAKGGSCKISLTSDQVYYSD